MMGFLDSHRGAVRVPARARSSARLSSFSRPTSARDTTLQTRETCSALGIPSSHSINCGGKYSISLYSRTSKVSPQVRALRSWSSSLSPVKSVCAPEPCAASNPFSLAADNPKRGAPAHDSTPRPLRMRSSRCSRCGCRAPSFSVASSRRVRRPLRQPAFHCSTDASPPAPPASADEGAAALPGDPPGGAAICGTALTRPTRGRGRLNRRRGSPARRNPAAARAARALGLLRGYLDWQPARGEQWLGARLEKSVWDPNIWASVGLSVPPESDSEAGGYSSS